MEDQKQNHIFFVIDELLFENNVNNGPIDLLIYLTNILNKINIKSVSNKILEIGSINYVIKDEEIFFYNIKGIKSSLPSYRIEEPVWGKIDKIPEKEFVLQYKIAKNLSADYYVSADKHFKSLLKEQKRGQHRNTQIIPPLKALRLVRALLHANDVRFGAAQFASVKESVMSRAPFHFSKNLNLIFDKNRSTYKKLPVEIGWGIRNILSFLIETRDKIEILFYEKQNEYNAIVDSVYYLNYFFILMCSLFDNLAWFLVKYYDIKYDDPKRVKLNEYRIKNSVLCKFFSETNEHNDLHEFIQEKHNFIEIFFPLRNLIAHRPRIPSLLTSVDKSRYITYDIGLENGLFDYLKSKDGKKYNVKYWYDKDEDENKISISPLKFIYAVFDDLKIFLDLLFQNIYKYKSEVDSPLIFKAKSDPVCDSLAKLESV